MCVRVEGDVDRTMETKLNALALSPEYWWRCWQLTTDTFNLYISHVEYSRIRRIQCTSWPSSSGKATKQDTVWISKARKLEKLFETTIHLPFQLTKLGNLNDSQNISSCVCAQKTGTSSTMSRNLRAVFVLMKLSIFYAWTPLSVHSCEGDISRMHRRNIFKFGARVHLDSWMNWFEFYSPKVKGQGHCVGHISTVNVIMMTIIFYTNVSSMEMMTWWHVIAKSQRSTSLWHPILQKNVLALVQHHSLGKAT